MACSDQRKLDQGKRKHWPRFLSSQYFRINTLKNVNEKLDITHPFSVKNPEQNPNERE